MEPIRIRQLRRVIEVVVVVWALAARAASAQGLGGTGTIQGTVKDPTGGVMQSVEVVIRNPISGFIRTATTDQSGTYVFTNLPPSTYHLSVEAQGFAPLEQDVDLRSGVPVTADLMLALAGATTEVDVVAHAEDLLERDPSAHLDLDQSTMEKLPLGATGGLNQIVTLASPGVVSDSNGFFHPIGDHAQTQFSIDNQPVTDQQSRVYSNQISPDAVQSMEVITGVAPAEYGDKSSLVVHIVTKSGLNQPKPTGSLTAGYGTFRTPTANLSLGFGSRRLGNFVSLGGMRTNRFLDSPELQAQHDTGHSLSIFDRLDARLNDTGTLHVNIQAARSSFDVPTTVDATVLGQAQHQNVDTLNLAPGYTQVLGQKTLFSANAFVRRDHLTYDPSRNAFADQPGSVSQDRRLTNVGLKADVVREFGRHTVKVGGSISATRLQERFSLGFTDPAFNAPCLGADGTPAGDGTLTGSGQCVGDLTPNPEFNPSLVAFDLTRSGTPFRYDQADTIAQQAAYVQDDFRLGALAVKAGLRLDRYDGLTKASLLQPRLGASYALFGNRTVLRASYGRTMETPYNENLLLSSGIGADTLTGRATPPAPGTRHQIEAGVQQGLGPWLVADAGYFEKRTDNAYDFSVLFNTPILFPVAWDHSRIKGFTGRVNLVEHRGFSAFVVMAHTSAIFTPPGTGGVLLESPCDTPGCSFRIDHDQKFNATTSAQYTFNRSVGAWAGLTWRYDSGLVASAIGDVNDLLTLTPGQQTAAGVSCGGVAATPTAGFTACPSGSLSSSRLTVPAAGEGDPLDNPSRVAPRHLLDLGLGVDNLLRGQRNKVRLRVSVINLTNKDALYNFLSAFSGTHFVAPRAVQVQLGYTF